MGKGIICVDIGGTFTDIIALDVETGEIVKEKVPSTPKEPEIAMLSAVSNVLKRIRSKEIEFIVHASTIATNAILGQIGLELPKCAMLTTKGFRDIIVIGRQQRPELYNIFFQKPRELIQRKYRFGIEERTGPDGSEIMPLNQKDVKRAISKIKEEGIKAVAICFLNSYANPTHEMKAKNLVEKECKVFTVASSEICPEYREY
ncbi:MAG: hydantoinase/oxoprolinase family protein, partial [Thermoproteota archaeon]